MSNSMRNVSLLVIMNMLLVHVSGMCSIYDWTEHARRIEHMDFDGEDLMESDIMRGIVNFFVRIFNFSKRIKFLIFFLEST